VVGVPPDQQSTTVPDFDAMACPMISLICFRQKPLGLVDIGDIEHQTDV